MASKAIVEKIYSTAILVLFFIIFSTIVIKFFIPKTIIMVNEFPYPTEYYSVKKIFEVLLSNFILFLFFFIYYKVIINKLNKFWTNVFITFFIIFIVVSEITITSIAFNPIVGDYAIIKQGIVSFFNGDHAFLKMNQLLAYPYNTHLVLMAGYLAKLLNSVNLAIKILPITCITISIILNAMIINKITHFKAEHISILLAVLNIFIYWQAPVFYTHTTVIAFLSATLYAYLTLQTVNSRKKRIVWCFALGLFAACTYLIRPTALSIFIAIFIDNLFKFDKSRFFNILSSSIFCIVLVLGYNTVTTKYDLNTDNNTIKIPFSHWVKLGLNKETYGVWNQADVTYPPSITNTNERNQYNKEIIAQRLKSYGFQGYMEHLNEKVEREWVSSQFSMYRVGEWFQQKNKIITNLVSNYSSKWYKAFDLYSYIIKLFTIICTLTAIIFYKKMDILEAEVLRICLISTLIVFTFLLLWETAPHYSYEAFDLMNIPASLGLYKLITVFIGKK